MTAAQTAWNELTEAGFGLAVTGRRIGETMAASGRVVGARMDILGGGA